MLSKIIYKTLEVNYYKSKSAYKNLKINYYLLNEQNKFRIL